ncbi:MAG TPA: class I SAM-dependent methyltransferase [Actinoplanes sp.]|nr:class I SAM-dependent methyltransferase [Actinoplanes sp.]
MSAPAEVRDWQSFFSHDEYPRLVSAILTEERTRAEVAGLRERLALGPGVRVLDLGCGQGRIAVPLARLGCAVTGLDGCAPLLDRARRAAAQAGVEIELIHADMADLDRVDEFDVVLNLGTAFGYAAESGHEPTLRAAARALRPGGTLLLDTENRERMVRSPRAIAFERDGTTVHCERSFDLVSSRWTESLSWVHDGRAEHASYSLRLYTATELITALAAAGFDPAVEAWGDLAGHPYALDSLRMVLRAARNGEIGPGRTA